LLTTFLFTVSVAGSQESKQGNDQRLVIEGGIFLPNATLYDDIAIRQNPMGDSWTSSDNGTVSFSSAGLMLGARWKWQNSATGWGVSIGMRTKAIYNEIAGNYAQNTDYFYLRYYSSDVDRSTKFARIKDIGEVLLILSVPIEGHYTFLHRNVFDAFITLGADIGYVFLRDMDINFRNAEMQQYESMVRKALEHKTDDFYGSTYGALGVAVGASRNLVFELCLPGFLLSKKYFELGTASYFTTVRFSLQIPIVKSQQP